MECAYHPNHEAVSICSICNKYICMECKDSLMGKVVCKKCKMAVYSHLKAKLDKQEAEERRLSYVLPITSFAVAVVFIIAYIQWRLQFFLYASAILFIVGIALFIPVLILKNKKQRSKQESKPIRNQKIGWLLFGIGTLYLVIGGPTIAITGVNVSMLFIILSIVLSIAFIIIGMKIAKW